MVSLEHKPSNFAGNKKIGSATTYIKVDTVNNTIEFVVNGVQQELWS